VEREFGSLVVLYVAYAVFTSSLKNAGKNDDFSSIADADALFVVAGDHPSEEEPTRKGTALQVRNNIAWIFLTTRTLVTDVAMP
jgi:hypothetical protein